MMNLCQPPMNAPANDAIGPIFATHIVTCPPTLYASMACSTPVPLASRQPPQHAQWDRRCHATDNVNDKEAQTSRDLEISRGNFPVSFLLPYQAIEDPLLSQLLLMPCPDSIPCGEFSMSYKQLESSLVDRFQ